MTKQLFAGCLVLSFSLVACAAHFPRIASPSKIRWDMVWNDEFNRDGAPDPANWRYETGGGGWGNGEYQHYTDRIENARVENGYLIIEARKEDYRGDRFTSSRLLSKVPGWKYGRVEVRAKVPGGQGTWPAIWMMPDKATHSEHMWPDNGEIDILEHVGREPTQFLSCFYTKNFNWMNGNGITAVTELPDAETEFHVFSLDWAEDEISISVDGRRYNTFKNPRTDWMDWPFDHEFHVILNMALGGFGGDLDESIFPRRFLVDYVRVYQPVAE